jgi:hypothetical protein
MHFSFQCDQHEQQYLFFSISITLKMCHDRNKLGAALYNFLHCPVVSSDFTSNILLNTQPSKCTSLTARDQFSNPQKGKGKKVILFMFQFLDNREKDKI